MRRREFLGVPVALRSFATLSRVGVISSAPMSIPSNPIGVKALAFDVFGTVVDWRGSIIREGTRWGRTKGLRVDWADFADRWRAVYAPSMDKVRKGALPWMNLDQLHRLILDDLLTEFNIIGLAEDEKDHWNRVWHRLSPWPDAVSGITRLKRKFIVATLSNGNISLLIDGAKFAGGHAVFGGALSPLQAGSRGICRGGGSAQLPTS
jgi:2-haloalkanoic acid dehalogenase type II